MAEKGATRFVSADDIAMFTTKDGREIPFGWLTKKWQQEKDGRNRLRHALCSDYIKYGKEHPDLNDDQIRQMICERREVSRVVVNNALASQGNGLSPKAKSDLEAKILVATDRQFERLDRALGVLDEIIDTVCTSDDEYFELKQTVEHGSRSCTKTEKLPRAEYLRLLTREALRTAKDAADTIRAFQGNKAGDTNVNVAVVTGEQRENRMRGVREKFDIVVEGD